MHFRIIQSHKILIMRHPLYTSRPLKRHVSLFRILKSSSCIKYALDSLKSSLLKNPLIQQKNDEKKNTNVPLNEE